MRVNIRRILLFVMMGMVLATLPVLANEVVSGDGASHANFGVTFLLIGVVLLAAKLSGMVERFGQPAVLGELMIGVILGNLTLVGIGWLEPLGNDVYIKFLAELGVVILLFQVGLESNLGRMSKVGPRALLVATVGVVTPFLLGYFLAPIFFSGISSNGAIFLGATLTATSVGITARVFKDLGRLSMSEAQIVLGAAVIDDVMGLVILAVVSAIVTTGAVGVGTIALIAGKALAFLGGSIMFGRLLAPGLGRALSRVNTGTGMKFALAMGFCLVFAWGASAIGLAAIVGAFAAGLLLDPVHFSSFKKPEIVDKIEEHLNSIPSEHRANLQATLTAHEEKHVEHLIEPLSHFLVPVFFVMTGFSVKLNALFNVRVLLIALGVTVVAFAGKIVAGAMAGSGQRKWLVGWGMVPRGEVGLIFATIGRGLGVVDEKMYSVVVVMVILTTLLIPPILSFLLKKQAVAGIPAMEH